MKQLSQSVGKLEHQEKTGSTANVNKSMILEVVLSSYNTRFETDNVFIPGLTAFYQIQVNVSKSHIKMPENLFIPNYSSIPSYATVQEKARNNVMVQGKTAAAITTQTSFTTLHK